MLKNVLQAPQPSSLAASSSSLGRDGQGQEELAHEEDAERRREPGNDCGGEGVGDPKAAEHQDRRIISISMRCGSNSTLVRY
jgi:hypothetical protein